METSSPPSYLALVVGAVGNVFEGTLERTLLVAALEKLAAVCGQSLDVGKGHGGELRGEELDGECVFGVESVDVDQAVVDLGHFGVLG